ncbi:MAG TPA: type II toxin-antitoxin system RelE/ParE family toxin [Desulfobulbaceae bacterium]|nr:MAG: hypothetical protein A2520_04240 [Deltaproteobacteria bacterium RIFOXYD12_FULL_53_23]HCC53701.1 type II toxin-antitoxin system RelE/ParE family toxin [Desulfobulbaceae bacterium]
MNNIKFVTVAREEFFAEVLHYNTVKKGLGANFTIAVEKTVVLALELALNFPNAGFPFASGTRRIAVKGFPIFLVYKPSANGIVIFAVVNQSRRSGYWCSRVEANLP